MGSFNNICNDKHEIKFVGGFLFGFNYQVMTVCYTSV
jgi:hypothetical protein